VTGGATDRLSRLLAMVPYLVSRQGIPLLEAAAEFGITERQLVKDLELLFVCGTPGHLPDDLIEAEWDSGHVYLGNAETIARPLRLGVDEAVTLLVGLRALAEVPGLHDRDALNRTLAKLEAAAGDAAAASTRVQVRVEGEEQSLATARAALRESRRVHLRYLVASRDEVTERDVDPMRVLLAEGRWYLEGWCHQAESVRLFRLDRVVDAALLDAAAEPPPGAAPRDLDGDLTSLFTPAPDDALVTLDLDAPARWVADYYPLEFLEDLPGGGLRVGLRTADTRWLVRLALRLGGAARIVEPAELSGQVAAAARSALAGYLDA
jgi:predicted DNA-binding transcriptional regulator YafY